MSSTAPAGNETWVLDPAHSEAMFQVRHLVTKVSGRFEKFDLTIQLDRTNLAASSALLTVKAESINTGTPDRDAHLRSADFFDAAAKPDITFRSTSIRKTDETNFEVTGDLTIRDTTKTITVPVEFLGFATDPWGNEKAGFEATTKIDRKDFGVSYNAVLEAGGFLVGDDVKLTFNLQVAKQK